MITGKKSIIVIPARMESNRFPGKPMAMAGGKSLVHWVYERAKQTSADFVIVATPDPVIAGYCEEHGLTWWGSLEEAVTGTHRCAAVLSGLERSLDVGVVVNWQCDEPLVDPAEVDRAIEWCSCGHRVITLVAPGPLRRMDDPNIVKVAVAENGRCHWFSREEVVCDGRSGAAKAHCGVYAFPAVLLKQLGSCLPTALSRAKSLEQLAWLEHGYHIFASEMPELPLSINTPADFDAFQRIVESIVVVQ